MGFEINRYNYLTNKKTHEKTHENRFVFWNF